MMYLKPAITVLLLFVTVLIPSFIGCNTTEDDQSTETIQASILIESPESYEWINQVTIPKGTNGYGLLRTAVNDEIVSVWYPEYRSHFVNQIKGIVPSEKQFWSVFLWNESKIKWEPLTVGADLFSVKNGQTMAWALVEYDPNNPQLPNQNPN